MDFANVWSEKSEIALKRFIGWLGIAKSKFYDWHARYGKVNEHNGKVPPGEFQCRSIKENGGQEAG